MPIRNTPCGNPYVADATSSRRALWATYSSGGYTSMGDGRPDTSAGSWWPNEPLYTTSNWIDGEQYDQALLISRFWTSRDRALPYWAMTFDTTNSDVEHRLYASSSPRRAYVVYSAVRQSIPLALPSGRRFELRAYDVVTGADVAVPGATGTVTGTGRAVDYEPPPGGGPTGDWVLYARAVK